MRNYPVVIDEHLTRDFCVAALIRIKQRPPAQHGKPDDGHGSDTKCDRERDVPSRRVPKVARLSDRPARGRVAAKVATV
jgi:hypothetical protein